LKVKELLYALKEIVRTCTDDGCDKESASAVCTAHTTRTAVGPPCTGGPMERMCQGCYYSSDYPVIS